MILIQLSHNIFAKGEKIMLTGFSLEEKAQTLSTRHPQRMVIALRFKEILAV